MENAEEDRAQGSDEKSKNSPLTKSETKCNI